MRNRSITKNIENWTLVLILLLFTLSTVNALPTPHGMSGYILELDGITQVEAGTHFSVSDITNGFYIEGVTGRGLNPGKYSVSIDGEDGDTIILKAWTDYNSANRTITLVGSMRNVNLQLNTSLPNIAPKIISSPITTATEDYLYNYQVEATDINEDILFYTLLENPTGMDVDEEIGLISWVPSNADIGNQSVVIEVSDGLLSDNQSFDITVNASTEEELTPTIQAPSSISTGGGGGGIRIRPEQKKQKVVIVLDTEKSPISQVVLTLHNKTPGIGLNITKLPYRPKGTKAMLKKVYQYLKIDKSNLAQENIEEVVIDFIVEKSWLDKHKAKDNDIILNHYTRFGWDELYTENISGDNNFVYYESNTTSFSYFAISLKYPTSLVENITSNSIMLPFRLYGIAYKTEKDQMPAGTQFTIINTNTGETVKGITGIGPNPGAYSVVIHGQIGDFVTIKIGSEAYNASFSTVLREDLQTIDFLLNKDMGGFVPMNKENIFLSRISKVRTVVFINSLLIFLILLTALILLLRNRRKNE